MKRGFTLLELIIVIIIIGILATLGFTQYARIVERARAAEAKAILGDIRKFAYAYYFAHEQDLTGFDDAEANIGAGTDQIPGRGQANCRPSHYYTYEVKSAAGALLTIGARRCTAGGKSPQGPTDAVISLDSNFSTGEDTWGGAL